MTDETWRPLGVDTEEQIAEYDALHDGVQEWMTEAYWAWVRQALTTMRTSPGAAGHRIAMLDTALAERMCQTLRIPLPNLHATYAAPENAKWQSAKPSTHSGSFGTRSQLPTTSLHTEVMRSRRRSMCSLSAASRRGPWALAPESSVSSGGFRWASKSLPIR